ncbi:MAG: GNAT family N-acetyltransferase [Clostridia bacterium]|nr:GNAT family N-acetyltransferase [Clostridia bacterium]
MNPSDNRKKTGISLEITDKINQEKLQPLLDKSGDYSIDYEEDATDLIQLSAYSSGSEIPVGFISCIILPDNQLDVAAFVDPSYRKKGIFTAMIKELLKKVPEISSNGRTGTFSLICSMSDETYQLIKASSLSPRLVSTEYLYVINKSIFSGRKEEKLLTFSCSEGCYTAFIKGKRKPVAELYIDDFASQSCMNDVWTDEKYRNKGIATALVNYALNEYYSHESNKSKEIILHVTGSNTAAIKLYQKCGFSELTHTSYYEIDYSHISY